MNHFVFDVESIGLHGEGFAVGWVVINDIGAELSSGLAHCRSDNARGTDDGRLWIENNVPELQGIYCQDPVDVRFAFWDVWEHWKNRGAQLWCDCGWPVEARFLAQCVDDDPGKRERQGPYPLHEIATLALASGVNPLESWPRLPDELPQHNPLCDARQSAR